MHHTTRFLTASILAWAASAPVLEAQDLYAGSTDGALLRGHPAAGGFVEVAQCAAPIHALCFDAEDVLVGDAAGGVHRFEPASGALTRLFSVPSDVLAMARHEGVAPGLYVAGSGGRLLRVDVDSGDVLHAFDLGVPATALAIVDDVAYVGSVGRVWSVDLHSGDVAEHGVPLRVGALVRDDEDWVVSDGGGRIFRVAGDTYEVETSFVVPNDGAALALHTKQVLSAGGDGRLLRVDRHHGGVAGTLETGRDVTSIVLEPLLQPGLTYCYGDFCPCGNLDHEAGCVNSTGTGALLRASGTASVAADDLFIASTQMPLDRIGLFFAGSQSNWIPFGDGLLCTAGGAAGPLRFPAVTTGASGSLTLGPGIVAFAQHNMPPAKHIEPGLTLNVQALFRDLAGPCGSGVNLSNALTITFLP